MERLHVLGLGARDILVYLDHSRFVRHAEGWKGLLAAYDGARAAGDARDFKRWLKDVHGAVINERTIRSAARDLDRWPADLLRLLGRVQELAVFRS